MSVVLSNEAGRYWALAAVHARQSGCSPQHMVLDCDEVTRQLQQCGECVLIT